MSYEATTPDHLEMNEFERPKLPGFLNVLTILTFIGCFLLFFSSIYQFVIAQNNYDTKDEMIANMNAPGTPAFARRMIGDPKDYERMVTKGLENKIPILIMSLVSVVLCVYGALQMRKLHKQGYILYLIGEILPFISMAIFIGSFAMKGFGFYFGSGIALLFILMYTSQRKHLVY